MIEIKIEKLKPNIDKIEGELINSNVLVDNEIDPYYSLHCFKKGGYNIETCFETVCPHVFKCTIEFYENGYLIEK